MNKYTGLEIAIIGVSSKFPGAENVEEFWENLKNGVEAVSFFTDEELLSAGEDKELINHPNYVKANSYLKNKEYFDSAFFNYRPDEARMMDPQTRLFHECVWSALEDAGCDLNNSKNKIGLFAGSSGNINWQVYSEFLNQGGLVDGFSASQLSSPRFLSSRISYCLNLKGPAIYIDTACSTSLVAIHEACKSLLVGDCNLALAGGVSVTNKFKKGYMYEKGMIYSKDGHCRTFDKEASGTLGSEGAGVVVLKTLKNAMRDRDNILAVIKGSGINNDGSQKVGYAAPSIDGQTEAIIRAQKWSKIEPESVSLIEAHGTATELGDPIEVEALNRAFGKSAEKYCAIGSVKSNFGHLDAAAGVAGLIKVALALKNRQLPPTLNFTEPNPKIDFNNSPFYVNTALKEWKNDKYPLRAGVSSFGIGGTNAHIILEEPPAKEPSSSSREHKILLFSAKSASALKGNINNLKNYLSNHSIANLADVAYTLQVARVPFSHRKAFVYSDVEDAIKNISTDGLEKVNPSVISDKKPLLIFMFSGQGSQYRNMFKDLYSTEKIFRDEIDSCLKIVYENWQKDLKPILFGDDQHSEIDNTEFTQPLLFVVEYALAKLLMKWGIQPDQMIGHSIGEYVAACISGVFSLKDTLFLVIKRGELMQSAQPGDMLSISISEENLTPILENYPDVSLAAINSSELCVVSGSRDAIEEFAKAMGLKNINTRLIRTSHAFHSYMMDEVVEAFKDEFRKIHTNAPTLPFVSNVTGETVSNEEIIKPEYWADHLRHTVNFSRGIETLLKNRKNLIFIEVGPGKALSTFVKNHKLKEKHHHVVSLGRHPQENINDQKFLFTALGELWTYGANLDWEAFYTGETRDKISLPTYAFDKFKYPVNIDAHKLISELIKGDNADIKLDQLIGIEPDMEPVGIENIDTSLTDTEKEILILWQKFFGKYDLTKDDDFFDVGGDSLKALTMIGRVRQYLNVEVILADVFENSTIKKFSEYIDARRAGMNVTGQLGLIPQAETKDLYELSSAQKRLYFLYEFNRSSLAYNLPQLFAVKGELDKEKLKTVFDKLVQRHESLRTSFRLVNGKAVQIIHEDVVMQVENYDAKDGGDIDGIINKFIRPFDLGQAPLLRVGLIEAGSANHVLMIDMHHIVSDGVSFGVLIDEFLTLYARGDLQPLKLQYKDYAEWQQSNEQQQLIAKQKEFWLKEFADEVNTLDLPADYPRPAVKQFEGDVINFEFAASDVEKLETLAKETDATTYMVLLSLFNVLLSRLGNQEDIVVGTPTAGRLSGELEQMVGMFVNTLPMRNAVKGTMSFKEFLKEVKVKTIASFDNQYYPYEELIDELQLKRDTSHNPLFDVLFSYRTSHQTASEILGLKLQSYNKPETITQFDLTLFAIAEGGNINFSFEYCNRLFKAETIEQFISYFKKIAFTVAENPDIKLSEINIISDQEKTLLLEKFNSTKRPLLRGKTIHSIFEERVIFDGEKEALSFNGKVFTYNELNAKSNQLARKILKLELQKESIVGILLPRSPEVIISILAVLKTGCAYVPIDPEYPIERIKQIVEDSGLKLLLTTADLQTVAIDYGLNTQSIDVTLDDLNHKDSDNLDIEIPSSNLAYMIYTSGSTGVPKGVMIEHRNVLNFVQGITERIDMTSASAMLCLTTISFDIFVLETILPLLQGIKIVLADSADQKDPVGLSKLIKNDGVDLIQITPSHLKMLLSASINSEVLEGVNILMVGGEAFPEELLQVLKKIYKGKIYNMYGPTETTVWSTVSDLTMANSIDVGTPIANTTIRILDNHGKLQPIGLTGELCIGGEGVGRGYWNRDILTEERFINDPVTGVGKLYRTGDLARWTADGKIECLGRIDNQVKIRGFRIELGEIESKLLTYNSVTDVVVYVKEKEDEKFLVAYYVSQELMDVSELRGHLMRNLPDYMIPSYFVHIEALPLTPNGKIDRRSLPNPEIKIGDEYVAPSNEIEEQLAEIWSEVLKIDQTLISVNRNFFELGGNSLKATFLMAEIHKRMDFEIQLKELFIKQDIESLADYIITVKQININTHHNQEITEISI